MRRLLVFSFLLAMSLLPLGASSLFAGDIPPLGAEALDNGASREDAQSKTATQSQKFDEATNFFTELKNDNTRANDPANWQTATDKFKAIHDQQPYSSYAAASIFMLGRITYSRYKQFNDSADLQRAMDYYDEVVIRFPWHQLADDSLFTMARIQLEDKKNPQEAARLYARITTEFYNGDLLDKTMDKLKELAKTYNTPIPPKPEPAVTSADTEKTSSSTKDTPSTAKASPGSDENTPVTTAELPNVKNRAYVLPVEHWSSDNYTRVVIKTSKPVTYYEELLEKVGEQPRRLFVDLDKSYIEPRYRAPVPIKDGLLQQIRTAQFSPEAVRVVLDIESIESYKIYSLPDPFRVIIDVHGQSKPPETTRKAQEPATSKDTPPITAGTETTTPSEPQAADDKKEEIVQNEPLLIQADSTKIKFSARGKKLAPERNAPLPNPALSLAQQLNLGVHRIVIDPGHGGKDPGASSFDMKEKDLVLQLAKKLAKKLKDELGAEVILTRDKDTFISLEERTAIANTNNADLFISLHLNAHSSSKIYGFETYYLNLSTDPEAIRVAALENATSTHQLGDLQSILSDIMKNSKIDESSRLATKVQDAIFKGLNDKKFPQAKSLGVKQAPFYVLIGAEMPAILIEMAFISNKTDANHIKKDTYQDAMAEEIVHGIQQYISTITAKR